MKFCLGWMGWRSQLISGFLSVVLAATAEGQTWTGAGGDGQWGTATNWSGNAVPATNADLIFDTATPVANTDNIAALTIGSITFGATAPAYTITVAAQTGFTPRTLTINGTGIVNLSSSQQTLINQGGGGSLYEGTTIFASSSAGNLNISNQAGSSSNRGGKVYFTGTAGAGTSTITNNGGVGASGTYFQGASSAQQSTIINQGGSGGGFDGSKTEFFGTATAGSSTIINQGSVADSALGGITVFNDSSSAGSSTITATGSSFVNGGGIAFEDNADAGSATLTAQAGLVSGQGAGLIEFEGASTGGTARIILETGPDNNSGGALSLGQLTVAGLSVGSVEGGGRIFLSDKTLTVGSLNTDTEFSGYLLDNGNITKVGTGRLILSRNNAGYNGTATINGGILQIGNGGATGSIGGPIVNNASLIFHYDHDFGYSGHDGVISGTGTVTVQDAAAFILSAANTYTGATVLNNTTLRVTQLADGGVASQIGAASAAAGNLVINGSVLSYEGDGGTTNRLFTLSNNGGTIEAMGLGAIQFTNTGALGMTGSGNRILTLKGSNTDNNILAASIGDAVGWKTNVNFNVDPDNFNVLANWTLSGLSTYTGVTRVAGFFDFGSILSVTTLADGGSASSIGQSSNAAANLVFDGGGLRYIGATASTDRRFTIGTAGALLDASGTGAITFSSTNSGAVTLAGTNTARTLTLTGTNTDNNILAGAIGNNGTGATSLVKDGVGTWVLTGTNTFTGGTTINGGTLQIGNGGTAGALSNTGGVVNNGSLVFNRSNAYTYSGAISGSGSVTKLGAGTLTLSSNSYTGATSIRGGAISVANLANGGSNSGIGRSSNAAANLVLDGGTLRYAGTSAATTNRRFTLGTSGGGLDASSTSSSNTVTFSDTNAVTLTGTNTARTLTLSGSNTGNNTLAAALGDNGTGATSVVKSGAGKWVLSGANTYSGTTDLQAGTLAIGSNSALGTGTFVLNGAVTFQGSDGTTRTLGNNISLMGTTTMSGTADLVFNSGTLTNYGDSTLQNYSTGNSNTGNKLTLNNINLTTGSAAQTMYLYTSGMATAVINGVIANGGAGAGQLRTIAYSLTLNGANTHTGGTFLQNGATIVGNDQAFGTGLVTLNTGTLQGNGTARTLANNIFVQGGATVGGTSDLTFNGALSGTAQLTVSNTASTKFNGDSASTFSGTLTLSSGATLLLGHNNAVGSGALRFNGGTLLSDGNARTLNNAINYATLNATIAGTGDFTFNGLLSNTYSIGNNTLTNNNTGTVTFKDINLTSSATGRTLTFAGTGNTVVTGLIANGSAGASGVTKSGTGTLTINGNANTYTGKTTINSGTVAVTSVANLSSASSLGGPTTAANGTIDIGSGANEAILKYLGTLAGGHTSDRTINLAGTTGGATLDASGTGAVSFTGGVTATGVGSKTLTLTGTNAGNNTLGGAIVNNSASNRTSVTKSGTGKWVLTGSNTYTGNTTVTGGTLALSTTGNNNIASSSKIIVGDTAAHSSAILDVTGVSGTGGFQVSSGQTLAGHGTVVGNVTIGTGATITPGNSPDVLSQTGNQTWLGGGNYNWQMYDAAGVAGPTGFSSISITGDLDLTQLSSGNKFNINLWSLNGIAPDSNGNAINFDSLSNGSWTLVSTTGAINGFDLSDFNLNLGAINGTGGFTNNLSGGLFTLGLSEDQKKLELKFQTVPEPSTWALLALGSLALWIGWRRKQRV